MASATTSTSITTSFCWERPESGKTYLACALGMAAARQFLPVKYVRLPDLLVDFSIARGNGTIRKFKAQYKNMRCSISPVLLRILSGICTLQRETSISYYKTI